MVLPKGLACQNQAAVNEAAHNAMSRTMTHQIHNGTSLIREVYSHATYMEQRRQ